MTSAISFVISPATKFHGKCFTNFFRVVRAITLSMVSIMHFGGFDWNISFLQVDCIINNIHESCPHIDSGREVTNKIIPVNMC